MYPVCDIEYNDSCRLFPESVYKGDPESERHYKYQLLTLENILIKEEGPASVVIDGRIFLHDNFLSVTRLMTTIDYFEARKCKVLVFFPYRTFNDSRVLTDIPYFRILVSQDHLIFTPELIDGKLSYCRMTKIMLRLSVLTGCLIVSDIAMKFERISRIRSRETTILSEKVVIPLFVSDYHIVFNNYPAFNGMSMEELLNNG